MHARLAVARRELPRAVRIAIAAALSWWVARLLGADRPVFAVIVPMVAIRDDTHAALSLSLGRMLGVIAGVVLGIAVVAVAGVSTAAIVLLLVVGLAIGLFLRTGPELNTQIAISALLVVIVTRNADDYAVERIWETGVGSVVSLVVAAFVLPPDPLAECARRLAASRRRAGRRSRRGAGHPHGRRPFCPRAARALRGACPRGRAGGRGPAALAAGAAPEPAAPSVPAPSSSSSRSVSGSRSGSPSRCAAWRATSPASLIVTTCEDQWERGRAASASHHRARRGRLVQGPRRRGLLAGGRVRSRAHGRLPARGRTPGQRDPAETARAAAGRARGTSGVSGAIPAGEQAELDRLRVLARRLGVPDEVRLLSPWAPVSGADLSGASGAADLLLRHAPVPVLGVTGSAGKTTTTRLAEAMLRAERHRDAELERRAGRQRVADVRSARTRARRAPSGLVHRRADVESPRGLLGEPADRVHHERLGRPRRPAREPRCIRRGQAANRRVPGGRGLDGRQRRRPGRE